MATRARRRRRSRCRRGHAMDSRWIEARAAAWLARRDRDDWSDARQARLDAWLAAATAHRVAFLRL
ncbi:DUF4880 domain-containing protein, partial [Xanthomonas sp. SHU 166]|uniref:DUF4880 domain-containing protein n=1 Tax=Xanthomonas sp. SHU 166 TaxID=1591170 RepID=UPI0031B5706D